MASKEGDRVCQAGATLRSFSKQPHFTFCPSIVARPSTSITFNAIASSTSTSESRSGTSVRRGRWNRSSRRLQSRRQDHRVRYRRTTRLRYRTVPSPPSVHRDQADPSVVGLLVVAGSDGYSGRFTATVGMSRSAPSLGRICSACVISKRSPPAWPASAAPGPSTGSCSPALSGLLGLELPPRNTLNASALTSRVLQHAMSERKLPRKHLSSEIDIPLR
jgi:hypothetical protein